MILISIKPEHCKNIFNGIKTIEWRAKRLPLDRYAVYCTKSGEKLYQNKWTYLADGGIGAPLLSGKVIGEFSVIRNVKYATVDEIPESIITAGCVSKAFLQAYSKGKALYANHIADVRLYDEPKELGEFKHRKKYDWWDHGHRTNKPQWEIESVTHAPQSYMHIETPDWAKE